MFDRLPHELALLILEHAVTVLLPSDRTALVHLAQTSKAVYDIVAPQLYRSICIPRGLSGKLHKFADEGSPTRVLAERVFRHTRSLHMLDYDTSSIYGELFQHLELISSHIEVIGAITAAHEVRQADDEDIRSPLRSVHLCLDGCNRIAQLSENSRMHITHLCGYMVDLDFRNQWEIFIADPSDWMTTLLGKLPALTHLGLNLYTDSEKSAENYDLIAFTTSLQTALTVGNGRLTVVAVRVAGQYVTLWEHILLALRKVDSLPGGTSGKIKAWRDDREQDQEWEDWIMADALAGRSIWTESRPVASMDR